ncbi:MAG: glycosyltransferase [Phycisphaerales bacterium]
MPALTDPRTILLAILALGALGAGLSYTVALVRVRRAARSVPSLLDSADAPAPPGGWPRVCVIVPAHNEAEVIGRLAASLRRQDYPNLRVVFALDRCTDNTEQVVRDAIGDDDRFEVVAIDACPDGWSGKTHAAWSGVTRSTGARDADMLLFTDADTAFDPRCVRACVAQLLADDRHMLSLLSTLTHDRWFERIVQPAVSLELLRQNPLERVNRRESPRHFANGQFMLFRRDAYERIGGHERVRAAVLEDLAFARVLGKAGMPFAVLPADGLLRCRMYRSWAQFRRGWKRIFTEAARRRAPYLTRAAWGLLATAVGAPLVALGAAIAGVAALPSWIGSVALAAGAFGIAMWGATLQRVWRMQQAPRSGLPLAPLGGLLAAAILFGAARDLRRGKGITWAGMTYDTDQWRDFGLEDAPDVPDPARAHSP